VTILLAEEIVKQKVLKTNMKGKPAPLGREIKKNEKNAASGPRGFLGEGLQNGLLSLLREGRVPGGTASVL